MLGTALLLLAAVPQVWALWVAAALVGVAMAFLYPSLMALTVNRAPLAERARAISSFTMFFEIGTAAGTLTFGAVADVLGKRVGFAGAVLCAPPGLWVMWVKVLPTPGRRATRTPSPSTRRTSPPPSAATDPQSAVFHSKSSVYARFRRDRESRSDAVVRFPLGHTGPHAPSSRS